VTDLLAKLDPIAVYAALVSTALGILEFVKWRTGGARFAVSATPNMQSLDDLDVDGALTFIAIEVRNIGALPTTITHVVLIAYKTRLHRILGIIEKNAICTNPTVGQAAPFELSQGGRFFTVAKQEGKAVGWSQHYRLYAGVYHTMCRRPLIARIKPLPTS
jgi:hypothetical protein